MRKNSASQRVPRSFIEKTLWPEYMEISPALENIYTNRRKESSFARKYSAMPSMRKRRPQLLRRKARHSDSRWNPRIEW